MEIARCAFDTDYSFLHNIFMPSAVALCLTILHFSADTQKIIINNDTFFLIILFFIFMCSVKQCHARVSFIKCTIYSYTAGLFITIETAYYILIILFYILIN